MNEAEAIKDEARERLFDSALREVVRRRGPDHEGGSRRSFSVGWLAAAFLVLGVFVTVGVGWLQHDGARETQDPAPFDAIHPAMEHEYPFALRPVHVMTRAAVARLPATIDSIVCRPRMLRGSIDSDVIAAVAARPNTRVLGVVGGDDGLSADAWQAICRMPVLEILDLSSTRVSPAQLRELRHAPRLRVLIFNKGTLDGAVASALIELPKLSRIGMSFVDVRAEGLEALAGLPHLQALRLEQCTLEAGWLAALGKLRSLRWLLVYFSRYRDPPEFTVTESKQLGQLPRLAVLKLGRIQLQDGALAALPASLEVLRLYSDVEGLNGARLRELLRLAKLRGLEVHSVPEGAEPALRELCEKLSLERFGYSPHRMPPRLWDAVRETATLRSLQLGLGEDLAARVADCARLPALETLHLFVSSLPAVAELRDLAKMPTLRRLVIQHGAGDPGRGDLAEYAVELRAALGSRIDVVVK